MNYLPFGVACGCHYIHESLVSDYKGFMTNFGELVYQTGNSHHMYAPVKTQTNLQILWALELKDL